MKILKNLKKIFETQKPPEEISVAEYIIKKIHKSRKDLKSKPQHLTEHQWKQELNLMLDAFSAKNRKLNLKSKAKRRIEKIKIDKGFDSFKLYIKNLK